MNMLQLERMKSDQGFIAALDQSGGSTPKALALYGVPKEAYSDDESMFQLVHEMRTRIMKSPVFNKDRILAAILFEKTMDSKVDGKYSADYLWEQKGIVGILKVDKGLADLEDGVQLMKPIPELDSLLSRAVARNIFGTKMRSVIKEANPMGIKKVVEQQFILGRQIAKAGLVPILEPEVDIHTPNKAFAEELLKKELVEQLDLLQPDELIMFKLTIPDVDNLYAQLMDHPNVVRVVALSGGYSREEANKKLSQNNGLIASFSRALAEGLNYNQSEEAFNSMLDESIQSIFEASIT